MDRIWCRLYLRPNNRQASRSFPPEQSSIFGRALNCCRMDAFNSMCLVLRVDALRLITPSAAEETRHTICCDASVGSSSLHPNCSSQFHTCRRPMPSQAPESAATNKASPLLSAVVDLFLLGATIGHQPSLPRNHDVPRLTLNRSASPAQSEFPYVNTEPTGSSSCNIQIECRRPHCHDSRVSTEVSQH